MWLCTFVFGVAGAAIGAAGVVAVAILTALLATSVVVHELGHILGLRAIASAAPALLMARGFGSRVRRDQLKLRDDRIVAAAGPLAPAVVAALSAPVAMLTPPWPTAVWAMWSAIAVGHAVSLSFPHGDGAALRPSARRVRPRS